MKALVLWTNHCPLDVTEYTPIVTGMLMSLELREQKAQITMARGTTTGKVDSARTGTDPKLWESKENGSLVV